MLGVAAQRIAWPIRKPRNNADECHCAETRRDGAFRAICFVAPLARGACHGRRVASRISSRKASVAATRDLFRGSLAPNRSPGSQYVESTPEVDPGRRLERQIGADRLEVPKEILAVATAEVYRGVAIATQPFHLA